MSRVLWQSGINRACPVKTVMSVMTECDDRVWWQSVMTECDDRVWWQSVMTVWWQCDDSVTTVWWQCDDRVWWQSVMTVWWQSVMTVWWQSVMTECDDRVWWQSVMTVWWLSAMDYSNGTSALVVSNRPWPILPGSPSETVAQVESTF